MTHEFVGDVLAHSAPDKNDHAWPHRAVRDVIESVASDEVERGIRIERFNLRGAYTKAMFEGGDQERARRPSRQLGPKMRVVAKDSEAPP